LQNQANTLHRKILAWIDIQHLYIPGLHSYRQVDDAQEISIQEVELYLPSSILVWGLNIHCDVRLLHIEFELCRAQANDALQEVRNNLRLRSHVKQTKMQSHRGQRTNTRSLGMITHLNDKINAAALKYRLARNAVFLLAHHLGEDIPVEDFPYLRKKDISPLWDDSKSQHAKDQQKNKKVTKRRTVNSKDDNNVTAVSWIWKRLGEAAVDGDELLQEGK
jgi:hypothetical protein